MRRLFGGGAQSGAALNRVNTVSKLQRVQNATARLVMDIRKHAHITPVLFELHWLPVYARIQFKVLLLTFKAIHNLAPSYIKDLIEIKSKSSYCLRSNFARMAKKENACHIGWQILLCSRTTIMEQSSLSIYVQLLLLKFLKNLSKRIFFNKVLITSLRNAGLYI
jgi:hypothetical protein